MAGTKVRRSESLSPHDLDILVGTDVLGKGYAVDIFTEITFIYGMDIEQGDETEEEGDYDQQTDPYHDDLCGAVVRAERDERQQRERHEEAEDEAEQVRIVVDPGQKTDCEQDDDDGEQPEQRPTRTFQHLPAVDHLDEQTRQKTELRSGWSNLSKNKPLFQQFYKHLFYGIIIEIPRQHFKYASKASDRVRFDKLFQILIGRSIHCGVLRLILHSYTSPSKK